MTPKFIIFIVILMLFSIFITQNAQTVQVNFLFWHTEASRALVLIFTFVLGIITGWLTVWQAKKHRQKKSVAKELKEENEHE
jgi:uncharacterized integral membrane protein